MSEYVPFGDQWKKTMMRIGKSDLVDMFCRECNKNIQANAVLRRIANFDYRGNRSSESQIAHEYLTYKGELK